MTDSGRHSALRQTEDGTFEIVFEANVTEVAEDDVNLAEEESGPQPRAAEPRASNRVMLFSAAGVAVLTIVAAIGWLALSPGDGGKDGAEQVTGFRPYGGGAEPDSESAAEAAAARRARLAAAAAAVDDEEPADPNAVVDEITESEPGWELIEAAESDVVVVDEGIPPVAGVEVVQVVEEDEQIVEEGEIVETDDAIDAGFDSEAARTFNARGNLEALRKQDFGRDLQAPRVPALGTNPLATERLRQLPLRNIPAAARDDESFDEVEIIDETSDDEFVDDEMILD